MSEPPKKKQKRAVLSPHVKHQICLQKSKTPKVTNFHLAECYKCDESTISKILSQKEKWLSQDFAVSEDRIRLREGKWPELDECLHQWFIAAEKAKLCVSDDILKTKAQEFAARLNLSGEMKFSEIHIRIQKKKGYQDDGSSWRSRRC